MFAIKAQPFDCMQYLYSEVQMPLIRCCIRFSEKLEEDRLQRSVLQAVQAFPILRCSLDIGRRRWVSRPYEPKDYVTVIAESGNSERAERETLLYCLRTESDPPIKVFLIRHEAADTVCIVASHMVCDGRGFIQLLYLLAQGYSEPAVRQNTDFSEELLRKRNFGQLTRGIPLKEKIKILRTKATVSAKDTQRNIPLAGGTDVPFLGTRTIDADSFFALRGYAKQHHATVNDMILTAYVRELHAQFGWTEITLPCPVDLRRFMREGERYGICNLTGNYFCHVNLPKEEPFADTLNSVSIQMRAQKTGDGCLSGPFLFHLIYHLLPFRMLRKFFFRISPVPVTSYTNLGILEKDKLCFGQAQPTDAYIASAIKQPPYFQITVSSFDGKCTLNSCLYANRQDQHTVLSLLDGICAELNDCVKVPNP